MGIDDANSIQSEEMKRMLVEEYCPREEIHKLEQELWTLTMKVGTRTVMCPTLVTPEYKKIGRYIWGLSSQIKGMVIASKPTTYDSAKRITHQLTNTEIQVGFIAESPESGTNKRKFNGKNHIQSSEERQDVTTNYAATTAIHTATTCNRHHLGNCSWCSQCNHQHACDYYICMKCKKKGHTANFYWIKTLTTESQGTNTRKCYDGGRAFFECGEIGHIKKECPKLRSQGS
nr:hypothetical protein LSAT_V11C900497110 [Lactuca sativa]